MIALSDDELNYLLAAFADSPHEWFLPNSVGARDSSARKIDTIVDGLARRGLMDAQPGCHARLTNHGRKIAARMHKLSIRSDPNACHRVSRTVAVVSLIVLVGLAVVYGVIRAI